MENNARKKSSRHARRAPRARRQAEKKGRWAENLACLLLILLGFKILARRYQPRHRAIGSGEIDIIARRRQLVVFVEVKRRTGSEMMTALTPRQSRRITQTARVFLARQPDADQLMARFDAVFFSRWFWPHYVADAWQDE